MNFRSGSLAGASIALALACGSHRSAPDGSSGSRAGAAGGMGTGGSIPSTAGESAGSSATAGAAALPTPIADCDTYRQGPDLAVCSASYLGGPGPDHMAAVVVESDGHVLLGGSFDATRFPRVDADLVASSGVATSRGAVIRVSPDGRTIGAVALLGSEVRDLAFNATDGSVAVAFDSGVAVLEPSLDRARWTLLGPRREGVKTGAADHIAVALDGTIAVSAGNAIDVLDAGGSPIAAFQSATSHAIAIDGTQKLVFSAGERQDDGYKCSQLRIPHLRAFRYDGTLAWTAWDGTKELYGDRSLCADSVGRFIRLGADGKLYFVGESHGGNTVLDRDPQDIDSAAPRQCGDEYTNGAKAAAKLAYVARFDPETGHLEASSRFMARPGGTIVVGPATADAFGNVFFVGFADCCIDEQPSLRLAGVPTATDAGGGFLMVLAPNFRTRLNWNLFQKAGWAANSPSLGVGTSSLAWAGTVTDESFAKGAAMVTVEPLQAQPAGDAEGYFAVLPAPRERFVSDAAAPQPLRLNSEASSDFCPFPSESVGWQDLGCSHYCACWFQLCAAGDPTEYATRQACFERCSADFTRSELESRFEALSNKPLGSHCAQARAPGSCR